MAIKYGKTFFALRDSIIHKDLINHVHDIESPKQVWETLEKLFSKKNVERLQFLKNELTGIIQDNMTIA